MDNIITILQSFLSCTPFRPFTIRLTNGETVAINDPRRVAIGLTTTTYYQSGDDRCMVIKTTGIQSVAPIEDSRSGHNQKMLSRIREVKNQTPFVPFKVILADNRQWIITNPDELALRDSSIVWCQPEPSHVVHIPLQDISDVVTVGSDQ